MPEIRFSIDDEGGTLLEVEDCRGGRAILINVIELPPEGEARVSQKFITKDAARLRQIGDALYTAASLLEDEEP